MHFPQTLVMANFSVAKMTTQGYLLETTLLDRLSISSIILEIHQNVCQK